MCAPNLHNIVRRSLGSDSNCEHLSILKYNLQLALALIFLIVFIAVRRRIPKKIGGKRSFT